MTPTCTLSQNTFTYNGNKQIPTVTLYDGSDVIPAESYTVSLALNSSGTNVGVSTLTILPTYKGNYAVNQISVTYTIVPANQPALTLTRTDSTSNTAAYGTTVTLAASGGAAEIASTYISYKITEGSDCASVVGNVVYINGTNIGRVTVTATKRGLGSYYDATASYTFTTVAGVPTVSNVAYNNGATIYTTTDINTITLTGTETVLSTPVLGSLALTPGQTLVEGTKDYDYTFTPTDLNLLNPVTGKVSLTVVKTIPTALVDGITGDPQFYYGDRYPTAGKNISVRYNNGTYSNVADKVTITYQNGNFLHAGDTNVTFTYTENGTAVTLTHAIQAVRKMPIDVSDIYFTNTAQTFDGRVKSVYLNKPIPEGLTCTITGNTATNAGSYTATAAFALMEGYSGDNYEITGANSGGSISSSWSIRVTNAPEISDQEFSYLRTEATTARTVSLAGLLPANCGTTTWSISDSTYTNLANLTDVSINSANGTLSYTTHQTGTNVTDTIYVYVLTTNYALASIHVKVSLTDKRPVTVDLSGIALSGKSYDGEALSYTGKAAGTYTGGTYTGDFAYEWYQGEKEVTAPTAAGTYTLNVTVADTAYFTGSAQKTVTITPRTASLKWADTAFTYDGSEKKPTVTVTNPVGSDSVTVNVIGGQTNAGKYRATAASLSNNNYQLPEASTVSYTINKAESSIALTPVTATYGSQATFTVTAPAHATGAVKFFGNGTLLGQANISGGSASITYSTVGGLFTAGSNTITAEYAGDDNYNAAATATAAFTLNPKSISGAAIDAIASQAFTGSPVTPAVTVKDGSAVLVSGTDYTVNYSSNTNAGTAAVTVSGIGRYSGTVQKNFTITPKASGSANASASVVYSDTAAKTVSIADAVKSLLAGSEALTFSNVRYTGSSLAAAPAVDASGVLSFALKSGLTAGGTTETVTVDVAGLTNYTKVNVTVTIAITNPAPVSGGSMDAGAKVTIPVSSGEGSVKVEATVKDDTAAVTITDAQIKEIASGTGNVGTVRMDVSSLDVSAATVPAKVIAAADSSTSATGVEVALPTGTVTLDKTALAAVSDKGGDVTVSVDKVDNAKLTETQKAVLGAQAETALVVDVTVLASGEKISAFGGGSIGVAVPYTPKAGEDTSKLVVWFINDDGSIEPKTGFYNAKTGKYEFQTKHLSQYVLVSFPFRDVAANSWYYGSAAYAYMNGLFSGTGDTTFSPETTMTRGMLVTVLWRMAGKPVVNDAMRFADVPADAYYTKAIRWAASKKIVSGYSDGSFGPNDTITREQMAAILYRYASFKGYDVGGAASLDGFTDSALVSGYAKSALAWAVNGGLVKGSGSSLMPGSGAARAQVAAILQRFVQKIGR